MEKTTKPNETWIEINAKQTKYEKKPTQLDRVEKYTKRKMFYTTFFVGQNCTYALTHSWLFQFGTAMNVYAI